MSQKIPFLFALTLAASFATRENSPKRESSTERNTDNHHRLNPIALSEAVLEEKIEKEDIVKHIKKFQNLENKRIELESDLELYLKKLEMDFDNKELIIENNFASMLKNFEEKITFIQINSRMKLEIIRYWLDLLDEEEFSEIFNQEFKKYEEAHKNCLYQFISESEKWAETDPNKISSDKSNSHYFDINKKFLIEHCNCIKLETKLVFEKILLFIESIIKKQEIPENQLFDIKKSLNEKFKDYDALETQIEQKKELAIKEWETKKEHGEFSESFILLNNSQIIKKYLMDTLLTKNSPIELKVNAIKKTVIELLPYILNQEIFSEIEEFLLFF